MSQSTSDQIKSIISDLNKSRPIPEFASLENISDFRTNNFKLEYLRDGDWYPLHPLTKLIHYETEDFQFGRMITGRKEIMFADYKHGKNTDDDLYKNRHEASDVFLNKLLIDNPEMSFQKPEHIIYWDIECSDVDPTKIPTADRIRDQQAKIESI